MLSIKSLLLSRIAYSFSIAIFISIFAQNQLHAEEIEISSLTGSTVSWGRKYFFDAPRFKDDSVQELLDVAISEKLKTYGIQIVEGGASSKYVLNYTILLGDTASQSDLKVLYEKEPDLKDALEESTNFEQGKLLISIRDYDTHKPIWKNSVEGLANLDIPNEIRKQRIDTIVDQAFSTFPSKSNKSQ